MVNVNCNFVRSEARCIPHEQCTLYLRSNISHMPWNILCTKSPLETYPNSKISRTHGKEVVRCAHHRITFAAHRHMRDIHTSKSMMGHSTQRRKISLNFWPQYSHTLAVVVVVEPAFLNLTWRRVSICSDNTKNEEEQDNALSSLFHNAGVITQKNTGAANNANTCTPYNELEAKTHGWRCRVGGLFRGRC